MKKFLPTLLLTLLLVAQPSVVFSQSDSSTVNSSAREEARAKVKEKIEARLKEVKAKQASRAALKKEKLEAVKLKNCERKQDAIVRRSTRLSERAQRQLTNFEQKANRVEDFYNNRLVPKGITLDNYDELLVDIEARKQAVNEATTSAKTAAENFDCTTDDPKGQLANYRIDMQNAVSALKNYRTAIKNLIVAVRTAAAKTTATDSADN